LVAYNTKKEYIISHRFPLYDVIKITKRYVVDTPQTCVDYVRSNFFSACCKFLIFARTSGTHSHFTCRNATDL